MLAFLFPPSLTPTVARPCRGVGASLWWRPNGPLHDVLDQRREQERRRKGGHIHLKAPVLHSSSHHVSSHGQRQQPSTAGYRNRNALLMSSSERLLFLIDEDGKEQSEEEPMFDTEFSTHDSFSHNIFVHTASVKRPF